MAAVFISYRRADCAHAAGRLRDRLVASLGQENVFFDVENVGAGEDFTTRIDDTLRRCDFVLVMIGANWNPAARDAGGRELDDPKDWVRIEAAQALQAGKKIIPVLVDGVTMPDADGLPAELAGLTKLNAAPLRSGGDFARDADRILDAVGRPRSRRPVVAALAVAAALVAAGSAYTLLRPEPTLSERILAGMESADPAAGKPELITNEGLVGDKYGIINDRPWKRKALVTSSDSGIFQPRAVIVGDKVFVLYLSKAVSTDEVLLHELALGSSEPPRVVDRSTYVAGTGYQFDSEHNLSIQGDFIYYALQQGQGRRYRVGGGRAAEPADFFPRSNPNGPYTSTSPDSRYVVTSIAGGGWATPTEDYRLATRGLNETGEFAGIAMYDRKLDANTVLFRQKYSGDWSIGKITWSNDGRSLFFDNSGAVACVWKYAIADRVLQKIVPEHEAKDPFFFSIDGHDYILYAEAIGFGGAQRGADRRSRVMLATE